MKQDHESLELLRTANPARVDPAAVHSPQAAAAFARIVGEPRTSRDAIQVARRLRPVGHGWRSPIQLAVSGAAGIAAALAVIVVLAISGSSAPPAFAGWTPKPAVASAGSVGALIRTCDLGKPVLVEARGPYTAALFVTRSGGSACVLGPGIGPTVFPLAGVQAPDNNQIGTAAVAGSDSRGHGYVLLAGQIGRAVRSIVIHRSNNINVKASINNGWYLAWWPAHAHATDATVTTASGERIVSLPPLAIT